jgi:sigma-B regulation protein RsbU (phosphoserine phosphatase)
MFGYHWLDPDHLAVYLLDVSGHGVGSSLLAVSAANLLSAQSLPNTDFRDPGQVLSRLNDVFQMDRQNNKYFTIWYGVYERPGRSLHYGNAGHPPPLLYAGPSEDSMPAQQLKALDPVIGMCPPGTEFEKRVVPLERCVRLVVYSDGVFEVEDTQGVMWSHQEFVTFMAGLPPQGESMIRPLLAYARQRKGSELMADDFSMLDIRL